MASSQNLTTTADPWSSFPHPQTDSHRSGATISSFLHLIAPQSATEAAAPTSIPPAGGKVSKRKSRASKRNRTTYIAADPANFRHMVQQVTGVGFPRSPALFKPDPLRPAVSGLDTSAFSLNGSGSEIAGPGFVLPNNDALIGSGFDAFSSFPTLESWKPVM